MAEYSYCPKIARQKKAQKVKRKPSEKNISEDIGSSPKVWNTTTQDTTHFIIPPPEYQDIPLDGPYEKFVHFKGQIIRWDEWESKFQLHITIQKQHYTNI